MNMQITNQPITQNKKYQSPNFQGIHYATVKLKDIKNSSDIFIYKLERSDQNFLQKLLKKLNLNKLAPEIKDPEQQTSWKELIEKAIDTINYPKAKVYLAVSEKRPCGILSELNYFDSGINTNTKYINYFATWPDKPNHNVKCAGKSLLRTVFDNAENDGLGISLKTCPTGPKGNRDGGKFYEDFGFKYVAPQISTKMLLPQNEVTPTILEKFFPIIDFEKTLDTQSIDLEKTLDINFTPSFLEKILTRIFHN